VDANDRVHPGGCPGPFRRILGIRVEETEPLEADQVRHLRSPERSAKCGQWIDLIELEGAEAVATFTDDFYANRPAITRHAFGRGLAYYVGTQVELDFLRRLLIGICEETVARPPLKVPPGVEAVSRENDNGRFLFLLNHAAVPQFVELAGLEGLDLLRDEMVSGQVQLPARDVRVIHLAS
jgi:beta-galactosidase